MKNIKKHLAIIIAVLFFMSATLTIKDYGISWDEPIHFSRGQAYLNYFLTGEQEYQNLEANQRRSYYQDLPASYFINNDSGHPVINDEIAAVFNYLFYQKLNVLGDIESYHLFNIFISAVLVWVVVSFALETYGYFAAFVSGISLALYPLFWSEAHFNIKDPAETAFFSLCLWAFWKSVRKYSWKWLLMFAIFFGLALGTKFNILFLPFIILPWLSVYLVVNRHNLPLKRLVKSRGWIMILALSPLIVAAIFYGSWPYLWQDMVENTRNIILYYVDIGTYGRGQPAYLIWKGFNLFPLVWIVTTTPPLILALVTVGIIYALFKWKEKEATPFLWLLWLIIPILRVSLPNSSIYGGVRQIMEFLPALALFAGVGANFVISKIRYQISKLQIKNEKILNLELYFCILIFAFLIFPIVKYHPNENVYFNSFIGGLKGAREKNIPYWGNSFGNAYLQAVRWLKVNAQPGSRLALIQGTMVNVPKIYLEKKLEFSNGYWSGVNREGEYLLELTHQGNQIAYPLVWDYVNTVLEPVYEVKVDGVAIAKVWKNDVEHSKKEFKDEIILNIRSIKQKNDFLEIELEKKSYLARLNVEFGFQKGCQVLNRGLIQISADGDSWRTLEEQLPDEQVSKHPSIIDNSINYLFPAYRALLIRIVADTKQSCLFVSPKIQIGGF